MQGELEQALSVMLRQSDPRLTVGGRTDAGVHARGQVAHLDVTPAQLAKWGGRGTAEVADPEPEPPGDPDARRRARKLTGMLRRSAPDITVHAVRVVPPAFDARFSALRRRYEYRLRDERALRDPLLSRFTVDVAHELDLAVMQRAADELLGLNDFTSFCKAREGATAVRELLSFEWRVTDAGAYAARIEADAFCHSMVRAMVGAVTAAGSGRITVAELRQLRDRRERTNRFPVMPAHGLSLEEIVYPADAELAERAAMTRARRGPLGHDQRSDDE